MLFIKKAHGTQLEGLIFRVQFLRWVRRWVAFLRLANRGVVQNRQRTGNFSTDTATVQATSSCNAFATRAEQLRPTERAAFLPLRRANTKTQHKQQQQQHQKKDHECCNCTPSATVKRGRYQVSRHTYKGSTLPWSAHRTRIG